VRSAQGGYFPRRGCGDDRSAMYPPAEAPFFSRKERPLGSKKRALLLGESERGIAASGVGEFNSHSPLLIYGSFVILKLNGPS